MKSYAFEFSGDRYIVTEVGKCRVNGRLMTEIEVREDRGDYYAQFRNGHVPRNASEDQVRTYIREYYVSPGEGEDDYAA